jgi:cytochrome oxidase Cu insertion factor (SCO1/SenC/PrrC family)
LPRLGAVVLTIAALGCGGVAEPTARAETRTPPPGLGFVPPEPGSYELPVIQDAVDGRVIDADGTRRRLSDYLGDRLVVLSFIYLNCPDAEGCPLATANLAMIQQDLETNPELGDRVRLISLSFDPDRDTPESMLRHWGEAYLEQPWRERPWALLTTSSRADLDPILDGFNQAIVREVDAEGNETGNLSHVLKVFLIDRELRVRNIYSSSFLHPAVVMADIETLAVEVGAAS